MRTGIVVVLGMVACGSAGDDAVDTDVVDTDVVDTDVADTQVEDSDVVDTDIVDTDPFSAETLFTDGFEAPALAEGTFVPDVVPGWTVDVVGDGASYGHWWPTTSFESVTPTLPAPADGHQCVAVGTSGPTEGDPWSVRVTSPDVGELRVGRTYELTVARGLRGDVGDEPIFLELRAVGDDDVERVVASETFEPGDDEVLGTWHALTLTYVAKGADHHQRLRVAFGMEQAAGQGLASVGVDAVSVSVR